MSILFEALYPAWSLEDNFFGFYDYLDNAIPPDDEAILNYQLSIIRGALDNNHSKWFLVDDLISYENAMTFNKDAVIDEAIQKIFANIDNLRRLGPRNKRGTTKRKLNNFSKRLEALITSIQELANITSGGEKPFASVEKLTEVEKLLEYAEAFQLTDDIGSWGVDQKEGFGKLGIVRKIVGILSSLQGALLEEEGTNWFMSKIPDIQAINTSKIEVAGQGQMISDILFFHVAELDLFKHVEITYHRTIDGKKESKTTNLKDFFKDVETHTGNSHIVIDSGVEDLFLRSVAGIQAKSGINQMPFNANKKNSFSIKELDDSFYKRVLQDLNVLYYWGKRYQIESKDTHETYNAMFNYAVSTKIPTIMQFDKNQFLLTRKGLISYYEYFYEEMLAKRRFFKAAKPVSIAYLDTKNALTF